MKKWQMLVAPVVLLIVVAISNATKSSSDQIRVVGDINQLMGSQFAHKVEMLQPVRIEKGLATAEVLLTYVDGTTERCSFEMEVITGTGVSIDGVTLRPRYRKCLPAT
jgi:Flp pilus assembly protein TadG